MNKTKILLPILMTALTLCKMPVPATYAAPDSTFDLAGKTGTGTGWTWSSDVLTVNNGTSIAVTGAVTGGRRIAVNGTASITLNNVSITGLSEGQSPILLNSGASLTLTLNGTNTLAAGATCAGIQVPLGTRLTIDGTGSLAVSGGGEVANPRVGMGGFGAGIGGGRTQTAGTITINSGSITASGNSAGIGGGAGWQEAVKWHITEGWPTEWKSHAGGKCGNITINGGKVAAVSIGDGGDSQNINADTVINIGGTAEVDVENSIGGQDGIINISGNAKVKASAISGVRSVIDISGNPTVTDTVISSVGTYGTGSITIDGGTITATHLTSSTISAPKITITGGDITASGISASYTDGNTNATVGGELNISGGIITTTANASINTSGGTINISGGVVTATTTSGGTAGIKNTVYSTGTDVLNISGGIVTAESGAGSSGGGAGIGGNTGQPGGTINISGGVVMATGGWRAAGIGGGGIQSAGVGGAGGNVTVSGGTVIASGGSEAPFGIGSGTGRDAGSYGASGTFSLNGNGAVTASVQDGDEIRRTSGILFGANSLPGNSKFYGTSVTLTDDVAVPHLATLTIAENQTLTIPKGITVTNNGEVINSGTVNHGGVNFGRWAGNPYWLPNQLGIQSVYISIIGQSVTLRRPIENDEVVVLAVYDSNGKMLDFKVSTQTQALDNTTHSFSAVIPYAPGWVGGPPNTITEGTVVKAFTLDGISSIMPTAPAVTHKCAGNSWVTIP